jgi:hypothetical protein
MMVMDTPDSNLIYNGYHPDIFSVKEPRFHLLYPLPWQNVCGRQWGGKRIEEACSFFAWLEQHGIDDLAGVW